MFASKRTFKYSIWAVLCSAICASHSLAQQQAEQTDSSDNRRVERLGETSTAEWEMDLRLPSAAPGVSPQAGELMLPDDKQNQQLQQLLSKLATNPGNREVLEQLNTLLADVLDQVADLMDAGSTDQAERLIALIQSIDPGFEGLDAAKSRLKFVKEADELLKMGEDALISGQIIAPENESAAYYFDRALQIDPHSKPAMLGLGRVQKALIEKALESARELDFETADTWLSEASAIREDQQPVEDTRHELAEFKREYAAELQNKVNDAMDSGDFNQADYGIIELMALGGQEELIKSLMARLEEARFYGGFEPGQVISDELKSGGRAPDVVIIDAGSFLMGSRGRSDHTSDHEEPQHRVVIERGFGLGVTEVTVAQFQLFVERSGYRTAAELNGSSYIYDEGAGRLSRRSGVYWKHDYNGNMAAPDLPVLHLNANDARAYLQWLALETGKAYRLPSEAEYEYVARADGNGSYWWGEDSPAEVVENLTGERDKSPSKREWSTSFKRYGDGHWGPAPAGSLVSDALVHPMGVRDIAGNVSEWMADCWHENYVKAPSDGSAWVNRGCERRVVRGGYWASAPEQSRAAFRFPVKAQSYGPVVGFRIARDL